MSSDEAQVHVRSVRRPWSMRGAAWVVGVLCLSTGAAAQQPAAQATGSGQTESSYEDLIREALSEFNAGAYAEARALFERAHAQKPNARTLRGLGITAFELKRYVQSLSELTAALGENRNPLTDTQRSEAQTLITKARRFVGKLKLVVTPRDASVVLDGRPAASADLVLNLGEHQLSVQAPGYHDAELKLVVEGGEDTTQRVALVRVDPDLSPRRAATDAAQQSGTGPTHAERDDRATGGTIFGKWWFWTAAGVVLAGAAVATVLALGAGSGAQPSVYNGNAPSVNGP